MLLRIFSICVLLVISFLTIGYIYQYISDKISGRKYHLPGKMVDMGSFNMHLYGMGKDCPSVILDSGIGCNSLEWSLVQPEIAKFTSVYSYDRAGYGWSEKSLLGKKIMAKDSRHSITREKPEVIVEAVRELVSPMSLICLKQLRSFYRTN